MQKALKMVKKWFQTALVSFTRKRNFEDLTPPFFHRQQLQIDQGVKYLEVILDVIFLHYKHHHHESLNDNSTSFCKSCDKVQKPIVTYGCKIWQPTVEEKGLRADLHMYHQQPKLSNCCNIMAIQYTVLWPAIEKNPKGCN